MLVLKSPFGLSAGRCRSGRWRPGLRRLLLLLLLVVEVVLPRLRDGAGLARGEGICSESEPDHRSVVIHKTYVKR